jgi:RNA polymerase sigma-70 factor (ECF subfamily)
MVSHEFQEGSVMTTGALAVADQRNNQHAPELFAQGLLAHRRALGAYARMLTREAAAADDLLQDTWERALRCAHQFQPGTSLIAWLRRIMKNLFTDRCRSHTRFVGFEDQENMDRLMIGSERPEPARLDYRQFVTLDDIQVALDHLETSLKEVFVLAYIRRLPYQTIAASIGVPVTTVGTRLWRARGRIRDHLEQTAAAGGFAERGSVSALSVDVDAVA